MCQKKNIRAPPPSPRQPVILDSVAQKELKMFLSIENGLFFFPPNARQMIAFQNPLDALIPKIPVIFPPHPPPPEFRVRVTSGARG